MRIPPPPIVAIVFLLLAVFFISRSHAQFSPNSFGQGFGGGASSGVVSKGKILQTDGSSFILQTDGASKICRSDGC